MDNECFQYHYPKNHDKLSHSNCKKWELKSSLTMSIVVVFSHVVANNGIQRSSAPRYRIDNFFSAIFSATGRKFLSNGGRDVARRTVEAHSIESRTRWKIKRGSAFFTLRNFSNDPHGTFFLECPCNSTLYSLIPNKIRINRNEYVQVILSTNKICFNCTANKTL